MDVLNKDLRRRIIEKGVETNCGHYASAFSCVDAVKYLYDNIINQNIDTFIMSKGHGEMALFSVLETKGYTPEWTHHLNVHPEDGISATTGSLGHGLPIGVGMAYSKKLKGNDGRVYVLCGDGEMEEGSNWEALDIASKLRLDNLTVLVDWNKYQALGPVEDIGGIDEVSLEKRLYAHGCERVIRVDGHKVENNGLGKLQYLGRKLNGVILDTIKGRGSSFLEENKMHGYNWQDPEKYKQVMEELSK